MQWIIENREWVFSGIGVFVVTIIIGLAVKRSSGKIQSQKSGHNSESYQAGGDINVAKNNDK